MQAIITKFLPATNTRPAQIKASCGRRPSFLRSIDYGGNIEDECIRTVDAMVEDFAAEDLVKYGTPIAGNPWLKPRVCGQIPNGSYVHVFCK